MRLLFGYGFRLGKTFVGSEKMNQLDSLVNLIICQKSKINDWIQHFQENYPLYQTYDLTNNKQLDIFCGKAMGFYRKCVGIINYELAWRRSELLDLYDFTLMLDESSLIQNRTAKQTKFVMRLQPRNVILLSGTPCSGKYHQLWTQSQLLGWTISERLFNSTFVNWKNLTLASGQIVKVLDKQNPYKNVERLKTKLRDYGAVFMKTDEVIGLPEQTIIDVKIPVTKEYKRFNKSGFIVIDDEEIIGDTTLTKRLRLRQLCGRYNADKVSAFIDMLDSTEDRLIVFYAFTEDMIAMFRICEERGIPCSLVNGQIKDLTAYNDSSNSVTFVQYQAGAMGLNLQKANKILFFTPVERCELWQQSMKRIHRIGQEKPCFYYRMICEKSIEEEIYKALDRGVDFTDELFKERCC